VGRALAPIRDQVVIATKLHITKSSDDMTPKELSHQTRARLEASLTRLGTDHVELYYQHRVNKDTPVEEVAACMGELIDDGKILAWGRSQATEEELRRAHAVTR
jgi:aryl-alcohol dehydrogenase-like predicted oxidoreductase